MNEPTAPAPDGIEPISAYRAWTCSRGGAGKLFPQSGGYQSDPNVWEGAGSGWVTASCGQGRAHEVPSEDCGCGFYGLKDLYSAIDLVGPVEVSVRQADRGRPVVLGRILLAGKVIEHEIGYRAERARIAELIPFRGTERSVMRLANELGVGMAAAVRPRMSADVAVEMGLPSHRSSATPDATDDRLAYQVGGLIAAISRAQHSPIAAEVAEALRRRLLSG